MIMTHCVYMTMHTEINKRSTKLFSLIFLYKIPHDLTICKLSPIVIYLLMSRSFNNQFTCLLYTFSDFIDEYEPGLPCKQLNSPTNSKHSYQLCQKLPLSLFDRTIGVFCDRMKTGVFKVNMFIFHKLLILKTLQLNNIACRQFFPRSVQFQQMASKAPYC